MSFARVLCLVSARTKKVQVAILLAMYPELPFLIDTLRV